MTSFKLQDFSGLIPRTSARLIPVNSATTARNTKLLNGEAKGFHAPRQIADFTDEDFTVRRSFRIPHDAGYGSEDFWLLFDSRDVDIVRSPIINDSFDRYYWAGDGRPMYNTVNRIINGSPPYWLGVPAPTNAPAVAPPAGADLTRAYVYTFVSAYGEESAPSPPTLETGNAGNWAISGMDTTVPDATNRNITKKRIYRTVSGNTSSNFFFVAEIPLGNATYGDNNADDLVALNNLLASATWSEPPVDLEGFVSMPNGYLVGWVGRRLCFSEQYRPHAWPAQYELSTEFEIVGLVVWGSSLIIGTKSNPYMGGGVTPAAFTMQKMDAVEPCLSRRGMVATVAGAYYPSINGLVLANSNGTQIITQDLLTKEEWAHYNPSEIYAAPLGLQYIAFNSPSFGFVFNPTEQKARLVELDRFNDVVGLETDKYTGNVYLIRSDRAWDWDPENTERLFWRWKSKEFHIPKPINFGAAKLKFVTGTFDVTVDVVGYYGAYNTARFAAGTLNTIGGHAIGGVQHKGLVPTWTEPEDRMPVGGSPLYPINFMKFQQPAIRLIIYANRKVVFDKVVTTEKIIRLPMGYKADLWQFEFVGNTNLYSMQIAETGKELETV
jgi:hypothetical protein